MDCHENKLAAHYWYWQSCRSLLPDSRFPNTIVDTRMPAFHDNCQDHAHQPITDHAATVNSYSDCPGRRIVMREMNQISLEPTPYSVQNKLPSMDHSSEEYQRSLRMRCTCQRLHGGQDWPGGEGIALLMAFPVSRLSFRRIRGIPTKPGDAKPATSLGRLSAN